jgi:hypothetical protein
MSKAGHKRDQAVKPVRSAKLVAVELKFELLFHDDGPEPVRNSTSIVELRGSPIDTIHNLVGRSFLLHGGQGTIDIRPGAKIGITMKKIIARSDAEGLLRKLVPGVRATRG